MSEKMSWALIAIILGCLLVSFLVGQGIRCIIKGPSIAPESQSQAPMITFTEIQQILVDRGHNIEIDGRIGKETLRAWSVEICNDYYRKTIARMEKEND